MVKEEDMSKTDCFVSPDLLCLANEGPLAPHVEDFAALLQQQGYSKMWARQMVWAIVHFNRWLCKHRVSAEDIDAAQLKRFLGHCKRIGRIGRDDSATLQKMLNFLRQKKIVQHADSSRIVGAHEAVCDTFRRYLVQQRGVSSATVRCYLPFISQFLAERFKDGPVTFKELVATDITGFVRRHAKDHSRGRAQNLVSALRSFLRHLRHNGDIASTLRAASRQSRIGRCRHCPRFSIRSKLNWS
jgi:integrase/recombinase XerD